MRGLLAVGRVIATVRAAEFLLGDTTVREDELDGLVHRVVRREREPSATPRRHHFTVHRFAHHHKAAFFTTTPPSSAQRTRHGPGRLDRLLCDVIFMADSATIGDLHVCVGIVAGDGTPIWPLAVGPARAKQCLLTGDPLLAADAERIALVNRVGPAADLDREATAFRDVSPPARRSPCATPSWR
jgi:Enoyl-CoA hydratase/isomerase